MLFQPRSWGGTTRHFRGKAKRTRKTATPNRGSLFDFERQRKIEHKGRVWVLRYFKYEQSEFLKCRFFKFCNEEKLLWVIQKEI